MRSPYNWAVLALVIELPSYGYELAQRFERTYGDALRLSTHAQVYKALDALQTRGLIELLPSDEPAGVSADPLRQPKPRYRASPEGLRGYEDWLVSQAQAERHRAWLLTRALTLLKPQEALAVIDRLEHAYKGEVPIGAQELKRTLVVTTDGRSLDGASESSAGESDLTSELIGDQDRLLVKARLSWLELARHKLQALIAEQGQ
jgi:DNA-binding PadR family transcriptional regulator